ncbi:MAG: monooxygenase [Acidobacteria bacterium]|nr:MAG: monooxygenase [Acidobacteriota bacterium]
MCHGRSNARMSFSAQPLDIFIIGGGPAGLGTAIVAAQHGLGVAVADHSHPPIDKVCGEGLMPDTLSAMKKLGITVGHGEAVPLRGIRFRDADSLTCVEAEFSQGFGLGLRRTVLHAKLVERAAGLGVALLWGCRVSLGRDGQVFCEGRPVHCKWVIGADGESSPSRKWAALEQTRYEQIRFAARQHFCTTPWTDFVEVYWARDCQIVVAPIASEELCIAVTSRRPGLRFRDAFDQVPALASRLRNVCALGKVRGTRAALRRLRRVCHGRCALVGDASGSVDPLTGEGIGLAFRQAVALVEAIKRSEGHLSRAQSNQLHSYQAAHDRIGRAPRLMSRLMLTMDAHPQWRQRALRILAAEPSLFSRLLDVNVGELTFSRFGLGNALRLGCRLFRPGWEL